MTTLSDLLPNPKNVKITFKELKVNGKNATYFYYDALNPVKDENGNSLQIGSTVDETGEIVPQYLYEYVPITVSIYEDDGVTERTIIDLEAEAAYEAILAFQQKYLEKSMEEYVIPDEVILEGNLYLF